MIDNDLKEKIKLGEPFYEQGKFGKIFSWKELETLLNLRPYVTDARFYIHSNKSYRWDIPFWSSESTSYPINILKEELQHYNCYFRDSSRANKSINQIAKELEELTNCPTDAHIYFGLHTEYVKGFGIHNDASHNFIIQVEGSTRFQIWNFPGATGTGETGMTDHLDEDPYIDVIMNPGDVVFIPRRYWHAATSQTKRLSVSFPMSTAENSFFEDRDWLDVNDLLK
jgi:hypothetical protein